MTAIGGNMTADKLDQIAESIHRVEATVAELSAWVRSERERVNRLDAAVLALTTRHEDDIRQVYRSLEPLATRTDLAELEKDLEDFGKNDKSGASDGNAYAGTSPPKL